MYHVNADDRFPVLGLRRTAGERLGVRDQPRQLGRDRRSAIGIPAGAQEYGYVVPDPLHPGIFFGGKVEKFDERTGQAQEVSPIALPSKQYRVVRTEPLAFDHFDQQPALLRLQRRLRDRERRPELARQSAPISRARIPACRRCSARSKATIRRSGAHRGVVYAIAPSYVRAGTIWAGTDDGLVWIHARRLGDAHWKNVTPPELTPWSKVSQIDASRFDDQTAFVAVTRFRLDHASGHHHQLHWLTATTS